MKENKLDKFFREKAEENLPEFDPKYWAQAERMLDDALPEEKDRRRGAWWWWLPLLLIIGCGVCWSGPLEKWNAEAQLKEKESSNNEKTVTEHEDFNKIEPVNKIKNTKIESENVSITSAKNSEGIIDPSKNNAGSATALQHTFDNLSASAQGSDSSLILRELSSTEPVEGRTRNFESILSTFQSKQAKGVNGNIADEKYNSNLQENSLSIDSTEEPTNSPEIINSNLPKTSPIKPERPDDELEITNLLPKLDANFLEIPLIELEDSLNIDSTQLQELLNPKKLRLGWSAEAVARREPFADSISSTIASLRAGVTLDYKLNKKWDLHLDLLARRDTRELTTMVNFEDPEGGKAYGFGVSEITNMYRFKTQYFIESSALFRYKLNERHALGMGLGAKYLFSVRADIIQRREEAEFNFDNYEVNFVNRDEVIDSGWWQKERTQDLLPFVQLRYDYRTTRNATLFFKMNTEYNRTWYPGTDSPISNNRHFRFETSFGFNYQF